MQDKRVIRANAVIIVAVHWGSEHRQAAANQDDPSSETRKQSENWKRYEQEIRLGNIHIYNE